MSAASPSGRAFAGARAVVPDPRARGAAPWAESATNAGVFVALVALHVALALGAERNPAISTVHAVAAFALGMWLALSRTYGLAAVAAVAAYVAGAEVFWRMTEASVPWEFGKIAVAAIFAVALVRRSRVRLAALPVAYFLLLVPSTFLTLRDSVWEDARALISGNLFGPLALAVAACFFSQTVLRRSDVRAILLAFALSVVCVGTVAFFGIASADSIRFGDDSNYAASGGFGPNQVSSALGLGALLCFLLVVDSGVGARLKLVLGAMMIYLAAQAAMTFSRGGLYNFAIAAALASLFYLKDPATRVRFVVAAVVLGAAVYFVVLPRLDAFTGGALSARFEDTDLTNRDELVEYDLEIFSESPLLGVGPGMAKDARADLGIRSAAHTEFSRLLSEHGILGVFALGIFAVAAWSNVRRAPTAVHGALVAAAVAWSCAYMLNAAMRTAAPSLMVGLTFARWACESARERRGGTR